MMKCENYIGKRKTAANERFHASGGADSSDTEQVTSFFALVRAFPNTPACVKPPPRYRQAADSVAGHRSGI